MVGSFITIPAYNNICIITLTCSVVSNSKLTEPDGLYKYCPNAPGSNPQIGDDGLAKQLINKESGNGETFKAKAFAKLVLKHKIILHLKVYYVTPK